MNHKQALKASECNPAEVLEVLQELEWECPECDWSNPNVSTRWHPTKHKFIDGKRRCVNGKVKYSWTPQVGEWFVDSKKNPRLIISVENDLVVECQEGFLHYMYGITPILDWQTIEEILEKAGYWLEIIKPLDKYIVKGCMNIGCSIYQEGKDDYIVYAKGNSRQEAVMKAVLALRKEMK